MSDGDSHDRDHDSQRRKDAVERALRQASIETPNPAAGERPADREALPWQVGDAIDGKYRLDRLIGQGGMGAVFAATHVVTHRQVALKIMLPSVSASAESLARFIRESQIAGRIRHDNVVEVYDVGQHEDGLYLVMELLDGRSLRDVVESDAPLPPRLALGLMLAITEGVGAAHAAGVVHRDLKPDNVVVLGDYRTDAAPRIKVLDFGISKFGAGTKHTPRTLTRPGEIMGTPAYMSPEQIADTKLVDKRGDFYSLGVMLYEMLEGELPFDEESFGALAIAVATKPARPMAAALPEPVQRLVETAMARNVASRFMGADQLCRALRAVCELLDAQPQGRSTDNWGSGATLMSDVPAEPSDRPDAPVEAGVAAALGAAAPSGAFGAGGVRGRPAGPTSAPAPAAPAQSVTVRTPAVSSSPLPPQPSQAGALEAVDGGGSTPPKGHPTAGRPASLPAPPAVLETPLSSSAAPAAPGPGGKRWALVLAAAALVLGVGGVGYQLTRPPGTPATATGDGEHYVSPAPAAATDPSAVTPAPVEPAAEPAQLVEAAEPAAEAPAEAAPAETADAGPAVAPVEPVEVAAPVEPVEAAPAKPDRRARRRRQQGLRRPKPKQYRPRAGAMDPDDF